MKKNKKQNLVAKYARKICKAVTMRDKTKYTRYNKHKVKYNDSDNTQEEKMQLLEVMNMDNLDLHSREDEQGSDGAMIRKELQRRQAIGYWKGGFAKYEIRDDEPESVVGTVRVVS